MGADLFRNTRGQWKVTKKGRHVHLLQLAQAIRDPDEIWVRLEWLPGQKRAVVRRRYILRVPASGQDGGPGEDALAGLIVFERGSDGWGGVTAFTPRELDYLDSVRLGVRIYRRPEGAS